MPIHVNVITPEKLLLSEEVDFIAATASDGEIGILPHHTPLLTKLGIGEVRLTKGQAVTCLALNGGFLEVQDGNRVEIFSETAELVDQIDEERARQAAERAKSQLGKKTSSDIDLVDAEAALERALNRIKVIRHHRRRPPGMG